MVVVFILTLIPFVSMGHPAWGIAVNSKGEIFFTDILHNGSGTVWKMSADGQLEKILVDFHAHDLQLDEYENLWVAENRWIQGVVEGEGEHTLLKISPDGKKDTILFTRDRDDFTGGTFAILSENEVLFTLNNKVCKKMVNGGVSEYIDFTFQRIVTLFIDDDKNLWITDKGYKQGTIYRYSPDKKLSEYATGLLPVNPENPLFPETRFHLLYGIGKDQQGNMYVTENADRKILRLDPTGNKLTVYQSSPPWHPIGLDFHKNSIYIMEAGYDTRNIGPRILRLDPNGKLTELYNSETHQEGSIHPVHPELFPGSLMLILVILTPFLLITWWIIYKIRQRRLSNTPPNF